MLIPHYPEVGGNSKFKKYKIMGTTGINNEPKANTVKSGIAKAIIKIIG